MARRARHSMPGFVYHVMLRGNNGQPIFVSDDDRRYFCLLIHENILKFDFQIIAFCLMNNHVHLAIRLGNSPISKIVQNLSFRYTRYFNYNNNLVGHLFQGRFKSILVGGLGYLRHLIRYIHLNPVRAGITDDPVKYPWSSHHAYLMLAHYEWLSSDTGLQFFAEKRSEAIEWYQRFIMAGIGRVEEIDFKKGNDNGILGDDMFLKTIQDSNRNFDEQQFEINFGVLISTVAEWAHIPVSSLSQIGTSREESDIRGVAAYLVQNTKGVRLTELAEYFGRAPNTIGVAGKRIEAKMAKSEQFKNEMLGLKQKLASVKGEASLIRGA